MGRKTFESMGRPLPNRRNIVISRSGGYSIEGVEWVISPAEAVAAARCSGAGATWVIGGAEVYRQLLPQCDELYLTVVLRAVQGDIFFPEFEDRFVLTACVLESDDFRVYRYRARVAYDWRNVSSAA
jgi:dihydrofolate reductase